MRISRQIPCPAHKLYIANNCGSHRAIDAASRNTDGIFVIDSIDRTEMRRVLSLQ